MISLNNYSSEEVNSTTREMIELVYESLKDSSDNGQEWVIERI